MQNWTRLYYPTGELKYYGQVAALSERDRTPAPSGVGIRFNKDGSIHQTGIFYRRGLYYGCTYYPSGAIKTIARYHGPADNQSYYGPSFPVEGMFYAEDGHLLHSGPFTVNRSGVGYPRVISPEGYVAL